MIYLITGIPGAGKTLYALNQIKERAEREKRPVCYYGIPNLTLGWDEIDWRKWYEAPTGAIIVIDECHAEFLPRRPPGSMVPDHVQKLAQHRHEGFDVYLITQGPTMLDSFVRPLVGVHWHVVRKLQGMKAATVYEWNKCREKPDSPVAREDATVKHWAYPKEAFSWYKSTAQDTYKVRIPSKLYVFGFVILAGAGAAAYGWSTVQNFGKDQGTPTGLAATESTRMQGQGMQPQTRSSQALTTADYIQMHRPRIAGLPHTAPAYDGVTAPTVAPYPAACIASASRCHCYTQQATRMQMPDYLCRNIASAGYFVAWGQQGQPQAAQAQQEPAPHASVSAGGAGIAWTGYGLRGPETASGYQQTP